MKKTYGIKSLATNYLLIIIILGSQIPFLYYTSQNSLHHSLHSVMLHNILYALIIVAFLFFVIYSILRYHFITVGNGVMRFSSLNPFYKPIEVSIKDIDCINYILAGKGASLFIATAGEEIKIPMLIIKPEAMTFYADLNATWPQIQTTGPEIKYNKKPYLIISRVAVIFILAMLVLVLLRHH